MIALAVKLKVKYGLDNDPSDDQIAAWYDAVERLADAGEDLESAGRSAALEHFDGVDTCAYFSAADNIEALLKALAAKK